MAKQLNVDLRINADTKQAKQAMQDLQGTLEKLVKNSSSINSKLPLTRNIQEAVIEADKLRITLQQATNVDTGKINLSQFNKAMKDSNMSIEKYGHALSQLGPEGQQAFAQLAKAITSANVSFANANGLVTRLWTTLKNTARWQISSSALKALYGGLSTAYRYAEDLNESLNNIRIVTGQDTEQMARFAKEANTAAKALSTTTTEYTKASLIYYQQGLSESEVKARTEATIKLANVSKQSARDVSDQMTAVWNNFDDGSESLEYYIDVMAKLGATTASSTKEISTGLEKFAAVAHTVGLSYEYATAALATVTAKTRQSAEIVGTAFKTLFARLQDLELGETLEDGTTLGKYSEALNVVGVNIKDINGEVKDMDTILNEVGERWKTISKDQQIALAQTVAGTRQYTQLVALMDNWDFMKQNLNTVAGSRGTLQEQADIYAESWEAARDRVKASAESIYSALLDDKFFINFSNTMADFLSGIKTVIDGLGGVKGLLFTIGNIVITLFRDQISKSLDNAILKTQTLFMSTEKRLQKQKDMVTEVVSTMARMNNPSGSMSNFQTDADHNIILGNQNDPEYLAKIYGRLGQSQQIYLSNLSNMNELEKQLYENALNRKQVQAEELSLLKDQIVEEEKKIQFTERSLKLQLSIGARRTFSNRPNGGSTDPRAQNPYVGAVKKEYAGIVDTMKAVSSMDFISKASITSLTNAYGGIENLRQALDDLRLGAGLTNTELTKGSKLLDILSSNTATIEQKTDALRQFLNMIKNTGAEEEIFAQMQERLQTLFENNGVENARKKAQEYAEAIRQCAGDSEKLANLQKKLADELKTLDGAMSQASQKTITYGQAMVNAAGFLTSLGQVVNQVSGLINIFNDETKSSGEKVLALISGIGMLIPVVLNLKNAFTAAAVAGKLAMWEVTLIVAAVTALIAIIALIITQSSDSEKRAKAAKKAAEDLAKAEEEAKQQAEALKNSIDKYDSAIEKIKNCVRGTQEWKDALKEVNETALDILKNISGINIKNLGFNSIEDLYSTENGYIEFKDNTLERLNAVKAGQVSAAEMASAIAQLQATLAQNQNNLEKYVDENDIKYYSSLSYDDALTSVVVNKINNNLNELADGTMHLTDIFSDMEFMASDETIQRWEENIVQMAQTAKDANDKLLLITKIQVEQLLGDRYSNEAKNYATSEAAAYQKAREEYWREYLTSNSGQSIWTGNYNAEGHREYKKSEGIAITSDEDNEVYQAALSALQKAGYNFGAYAENAVEGTDSARRLNFLLDGQKVTYTAEQIASMIAASEGLQRMEQSAEEAATTLKNLSGEGLEFADNLFNFKTGDNNQQIFDFSEFLANLSVNSLKVIQDENGIISQEELEKITGINLEEISEKYHLDLSEILNQLQKDLNEVNQAIDVDAWNVIDRNSLGALLVRSYGMLQEEGLSTKDIVNLQNSGQKFKEANIDNENVLLTFSNLATKFDNSKSLLAFLDELNKLNFSSESSVEKVTELLKELGIYDQYFEADDFINAIAELPKIFNISTSEFEQSQTKLKKILGKDGLSLGDIVSPDDMKELKAIDENIDSYFTKMDDGSYALTGKAEEFNRVIKQINLDKIKDQILDFRKKSVGTSNENKLEYLSSFEPGSFNFNNEQTKLLEDYKLSGINNLDIDEDMLNDMLSIVMQKESTLQAQYLSSAASLEELFAKSTELGTYYSDAYSQALINIASKYENTTEEVLAYQTALLSGDKVQKDNAESMLELSIRTGELADKYSLDAQEIENYSKRLAETFKEAGIEQLTAARLSVQAAIANQRLDRGLTKLNKNLDDYKEKLKTTNKGSAEWSSTMDELKTDLADILNVDVSTLTDAFGEATLDSEDLKKALDGDIDAIQRLQAAAAEEMMLSIETNLKGEDLSNFVSQWEYLKANMENAIEAPEVDQSSLISSFNSMIEAGRMTKEQIEAALAGLHVSANLKTTYNAVTHDVPTTITEQTRDIIGYDQVDTNMDGKLEPIPRWKTTTTTYTGQPVSVTEYVPSYEIEGSTDNKGNTIAFVAAPKPTASYGATTSGSGKGGGGSSPTHKAQQYKNDESDRYHVVRAQLSDLSKEYDAASAAADRLFGAARVQMIDKEIAAVDKLAKKQKQYLDEIKSYREYDFSALTSTGKKNGIQYTVEDANGNQSLRSANVLGLKDWLGMDVITDPNGVITNYEEIMAAARNWYNSKIDEYNAMSASEQEAADKSGWKEVVDGQYNGFMELLKQYEETNDLWEEEFQNLLEKYRQKQDLELKNFQYKIEIQVQLNDAEIKRLEYIRKSLADDRWKSVEYLMTLWNTIGQNSTYSHLMEQAGIHTTAAGDLLNATHGDVILDENGNVIGQPMYSTSGWIEALGQEEDALYSTIDALSELDNEMIHYYEETLSNVNEKLNQYLSKMEDCNTILEHYKTLMELTNKIDEQYYKNRDKILKAQQQNAQNEYNTAEKEYALAKQRYKDMLAEYENTDWTGNEAGKQKFEDQLQAAYEHMNEWQDKALSKAEALAEAIKAVYENAVEGAGYSMEQALTGGLGFNELSNQMNRAAETADLLLTKTNQIYETNKLMHQLDKDIDKTSNAAAKAKLKNFADEIKNMQNMNEMSKFDLDVAKARYEILKAEIALEEAQNAKSTVRLQRDNEGNFGYVFTADQDQIDNARQELENKQNDLYNLTLNKANESAQALLQLDQDFVAEMNRINTEYANDEEMREQLLYQLREEYARRREILERDSNTAYYWLNQVAATDSSEAWGSAYQQVIASTEEWKNIAAEYISSVQEAHDAYKQDIDENIIPTVDELDDKINEVTADSEKYSQWFDEFADKSDEHLQAISDITNEYIKQRQAIIDLINELTNYIAKIDEARRAAAAQQAAAQSTPDRSSSSQSGTGSSYSNPSGGSSGGGSGGGSSSGPGGTSSQPTTRDYYKDCGDNKHHVLVRESTTSGGQKTVKEIGSWELHTFGKGQKQSNGGILYKCTKCNYWYIDYGKTSMTPYDTGGYTGDWVGGSTKFGGKLAMLHEKELVLNQDDTKNMLKTVSLVRQLSQMIDLQAFTSGISTNLHSAFNFDNGSGFEQTVTIHAEFPNATNHNEIEEAFNNLVNKASQYAGRK